MLERAARRWEPAPALGTRTRLCAATSWKEARGAACPWRGLGVVGRGELRLVREHASSAPRTITVPNEFTKECLWSGSAPPNGSRLSCGAGPCRRHVD